jgi:hypothetical protein
VSISLTQCRGLTPAGCIIDVDAEHAVHRRFPKTDLEGMAEAQVYIVCEPHNKEPKGGASDDFNPQMKTERHPVYGLSLQVDADSVPYSVAVARLRRPKYGSGYEKDPEFIPACTSMVSYSELAAGWRKIVDEVTLLAGRYTELYRAMQEFLTLFKERGIETELDFETVTFVGRMVVALQNCIYEILDPVQTPESFFGRLRRFFHSAAVYLDISPPAQRYFDLLKESGETEFISLLERQKRVLQISRNWRVHEDLGVEVRTALQSLRALERLQQALEGKYVDFRISPSLESMNFVFDRGGQVLYKLAAKPSRVQGFGDELTMFFAQLRLEGREKYRLILAGDEGATFEMGTKITAEIRLNEGAGFRRQPVILSCGSKLPGQRNFEFDFDAADVPTINDMRVTLQAHLPIRTALLFVRHRFFGASAREEVARPVQREEQYREEIPRKAGQDLGDRARGATEVPPWDRSRVREVPPTTRDRPAETPDEKAGPPPLRRKRLD